MGSDHKADSRVDVTSDLVIIAQADPSLDHWCLHRETDEFARLTVTLLHASQAIDQRCDTFTDYTRADRSQRHFGYGGPPGFRWMQTVRRP
jgi:hypothetical protein